MSCIGCHGGDNVADKEKAHQKIIKDPSEPNGGLCADCHDDIAKKASSSLHYKLTGIVSSLEKFSHPDVLNDQGTLNKVFSLNCNSCHASCGQCHVSRPNTQKGGLLEQHKFLSKPPSDKTCFGCHGARNAGEYTGQVGTRPDVHYSKHNLDCSSCHSVSNMHGTGKAVSEMYHDEDLPSCSDCHPDVAQGKSNITMHNVHDPNLLSCQVCHAQAGQSCSDCHVDYNSKEQTGLVSKSEASLSFKIGINTSRDEKHPWKYTTMRHVPTVSDSFDSVGEAALPNYNLVPNWKMSPTHNIQRFTLQNTDCNSCHGNKSLFLTEEDITNTDSKANLDLLVKKIPW